MKVRITKASDYSYGKATEFNTLEDLLKFQEECDENLIIAPSYKLKSGGQVYDVIIYDDYVEPKMNTIVSKGNKFVVTYDHRENETIVTTEELIQCKDCEYYETTDGQFHHWCTWHESAMEPDDYCSDAERREE